MERMHPDDLRALCAASIFADPNCTVESCIAAADALLEKLAETTTDQPK